MPQPLSTYGPNTGIVHIASSDSSPSRHRPTLALGAMHAIAEWSIVDTSMSIVFVTLLGNNPGPAAAIYASIGSGAKKAAFGAIAESSITDLTVLDLFGAISKRYASLADERHRLAHWVWGHASYIPDGVLLCDPRTIMGNELEWKVFNEAIKRGEKLINRRRHPVWTKYSFTKRVILPVCRNASLNSTLISKLSTPSCLFSRGLTERPV
jgi:hypothetical protein